MGRLLFAFASSLLGLILTPTAAAQSEAELIRQWLAEAKTLADLFELLDDLPTAEPVLVGTVEVRSPVAEGAVGTVQLLRNGAEIGYLATDGSVAIYDVATGKRRRAVTLQGKRKGDDPPVYVLDSFQRRIAVVRGRKILLQEFPVLSKVRDCKLGKGQDLGSSLATFCGRATLVLAGEDSVRIVSDKKQRNVKLPGRPVALWGNPREMEVLVWCSAGCADESETAVDPRWKLLRVRDVEGWSVEELASLPRVAEERAQHLWSPDGLATVLVVGGRAMGFSTRDGRELASGALPADEEAGALRCEGITHGGKHLLGVREDGWRIVCAMKANFPVLTEFELAASGAVYDGAGDRWVAVSGDRKKLLVFGPPSAK